MDRARRRALLLASALLGCGADEVSVDPPALDDFPAPRGELVYEEHFTGYGSPSWWAATVRVYLDGHHLTMLHESEQGEILAWARGSLNPAGQAALTEALASAAPTGEPSGRPPPCGWIDSNDAVVLFEGAAYAYIVGCPPPGLEALAELYEALELQASSCPFDWYEQLYAEADLDKLVEPIECEAHPVLAELE